MGCDRRRFLLAAGALASLPRAGVSATIGTDIITVGLVGPMTGPNAAWGQQMREGAEIAVDSINSTQNALSGFRLRLVVEDDAGDAKQAVSTANRLMARSDPINFIVGHANSTTTTPASFVYRENGAFLFSAVNVDSLTESGWPQVFRLIPPNKAYEIRVADEIVASHRTRIAIIHNGTDYARGFVDRLKADLNHRGVAETLFEGVSIGEKDFGALISRFKKLEIDLVVLALFPQEAGLLMRQSADQGFIDKRADTTRTPVFFGHNLLVASDFYRISGGAAEGTKVVSVTGCDRAILHGELNSSTAGTDIMKAFAARGIEIDVTHTLTFSAFQIIAQAISLAGGVDKQKLSDVLHGHAFPTIRGQLSFDQSGELLLQDRSLALYEIRSTGPHLIKRYG